MEEIIFVIKESPEGDYEAVALNLQYLLKLMIGIN